MPQNEAKFQVNQFTGGLVTDANPLADSGPISIDEDNCEIMAHGGRRRRRAAQLEFAYDLHSVTLTAAQKEDWAFNTSEWKAVAGVPGLEFVVYQQGATLWFYDKSNSPVSAGIKSFSVALSTFKIATASTTQLENTLVSVATGKGVIFVAGATIEPFYVEYDSVLDTVTATQVDIKIRDFEEQDATIGPQDEVVVPISGQHVYDLLNQGWYQSGMYTRDDGSTNRDPDQPAFIKYLGHSEMALKLPRKNTPWHIGKYVVPEDSAFESNNYMSPQQVRSSPSGTTLSPFGHYILNAFNKDREQALDDEGVTDHFSTGIADVTDLIPEIETERPNGTAFYAGRAWYLLKNNIYFSQQLDDKSLGKSGKCYQEGDPTNEAESDILATDGGLIQIPSMGRATAFAVTDAAILVLADNGIWSIQGTAGSSFSAVDFSINQLSNISCESPESVVEAEGLVLFWSNEGIHVVKPGEVRDIPELQDLTEGKITTRFNGLPENSKKNVFGVYDPTDKIVYWMYKASTDSEGLDKNRFAYDTFLNFSLKFSAFIPWSVASTDNNQIIGGTVATGVLTTFVSESVTNSSGEDVTDSSGVTVTIQAQEDIESPNRLKFLTLKDNQATFGEFTGIDFLDWNEEGAGADYSSFIETFYHQSDDAMGFMQAPYVYTYFKRTEEVPVAQPAGQFAYDEFELGGMTYGTQTFINSYNRVSPTKPAKLNANGMFVIAEDGTRLNFWRSGGGAGSGVDSILLWDVDTGVQASGLDWAGADVMTELIAAGIEPPGGYVTNTHGSFSPIIIPDTAYMVIIGSQWAGVSVSKYVAYYRIESATVRTLVGGYAGKTDGLNVQFSPEEVGAMSFSSMGWANFGQTDLTSTSDSRFVSHSTLQHQYPITLSYRGETRSTILTIPSINAAINGSLGLESATNPWLGREDSLGTLMDDNALFVADNPGTDDQRARAFVLPTTAGSRWFTMWNQNDIDQHIAATETTTSTFLQTHDSTYPTGFISSVDIGFTADAVDEFGFDTALANLDVDAHVKFTGYPFTDETDDFDETAGVATDNFTINPSAFPVYDDNILGPWMLFVPKLFQKAGDEQNIEIKTFSYDPTTGNAILLDSAKGQIIDFTVDTGETGWTPQSANVHWNKVDGTLTVQGLLTKSGEGEFFVSEFGTFIPQVNGITDFFATLSGDPVTVESACVLNTRWGWANSTASGKISSDIQIYRGGRTHFVTDPDTPEATGLPVLVSKTKTRGRGRAMQLRFRSEQGKDFELYGWAVWAAKNTRF